jgi:hypothetical protein
MSARSLQFSQHYLAGCRKIRNSEHVSRPLPSIDEIENMVNLQNRNLNVLERMRTAALSQEHTALGRNAHEEVTEAGQIDVSLALVNFRRNGGIACPGIKKQRKVRFVTCGFCSASSFLSCLHPFPLFFRPLFCYYFPLYSSLSSGYWHHEFGLGSMGCSDLASLQKVTHRGRCHSCSRVETPIWRRGPRGARTLCNACGLRYAELLRKMSVNKAPSALSSLKAEGSSKFGGTQ